jgi:hypothetical protein
MTSVIAVSVAFQPACVPFSVLAAVHAVLVCWWRVNLLCCVMLCRRSSSRAQPGTVSTAAQADFAAQRHRRQPCCHVQAPAECSRSHLARGASSSCSSNCARRIDISQQQCWAGRSESRRTGCNSLIEFGSCPSSGGVAGMPRAASAVAVYHSTLCGLQGQQKQRRGCCRSSATGPDSRK